METKNTISKVYLVVASWFDDNDFSGAPDHEYYLYSNLEDARTKAEALYNEFRNDDWFTDDPSTNIEDISQDDWYIQDEYNQHWREVCILEKDVN